MKSNTCCWRRVSLGRLSSRGPPEAGACLPVFGLLNTRYHVKFVHAELPSGAGGEGRRPRTRLDGGRGLVAALLASASVAIFAAFLPTDVASASFEQRSYALSRIIWIFTGLTFLVSLLVWFALPTTKTKSEERQKLTLEGVRKVMRMPAIWLQAIIVVCAYVGYKSTDDFSLYARDAFGYDDVAAARIGTITFWVRPFAAVSAGLLGDYIRSSRMVTASFAILATGALTIASGILQPGMYWVLIATIAGTSVGIYALRGVYFALFQEAKVPLAVTGSAVLRGMRIAVRFRLVLLSVATTPRL